MPIRIKQTGQRTFPSLSQPRLLSAIDSPANPFNQTVVAWVNGTHFFSPIRPVRITKRYPRTEYITME